MSGSVGGETTPVDYLLSPLREADIQAAYLAFAGFGIDPARTQVTARLGSGEVIVEVDFFDSSGVSIMREDGKERLLLKRRWIPHRPLRARDGHYGKVIFNEMTCFRQNVRQKGLGRALFAHEDRLFRRWGATEIQLNVGCEARTTGVWQKRDFVPSTLQRRFLEELWKDYCVENELPQTPLPVEWAAWDKTFRDECVTMSVQYLHMVREL